MLWWRNVSTLWAQNSGAEVFCKESGTECLHCEQLWAKADDDVYQLHQDMEDVWSFYAKGERRVMKNWEGMKGMPEFYGDEV